MEKRKEFIVNILYYALILALLLVVCKYLLPILVPFIIAFIIAYIVGLPSKALSKGNITRKKHLSIIFCIIFYILAFLLIFLIGAKIVEFVASVATSLPSMYNDTIVPLISELALWIEEKVSTIDPSVALQIENALNGITQNMGTYISNFSVSAMKLVSTGVTGIPNLIVTIVVTVIATFFIVSDFEGVKLIAKKLIPSNKQASVRHIITYTKEVIFIYAKSYTLLFLLTFVELSIGLLIFRIPYAVFIALAIAIFDILPVLGTGGILLPWSVILIAIGNIPLGIGILVLYLIITAIRNTVEPKIVGKQIGLNSLATLISMYIGLKLIGILGMFIFPTALAIFVGMKDQQTNPQ